MTDLLLMAQPEGEGGGGGFQFLIFLGLIFTIMYFFMIRPQQKKAKETKQLQASLDKGDKIVTVGGIHGKILENAEHTFLVEVDQGTKIRIEKSVISMEMTKALQERTGSGQTKD